MEITTYLLLVLGVLGGTDILLFHSVAHGIRSHPDSVRELITHSLRGPTYALLFILIPNLTLHGWFAWGLVALLLFDVAISVWDFSVEQGSRRLLGGLPAGEYVMHMVMAMVFGAMAAGFLYGAQNWFVEPTRVFYSPAGVPAIVRGVLALFAVLVLVSGLQDALAALRLRKLTNGYGKAAPPALQDAVALEDWNWKADSAAPWTSNGVPRWMKFCLVFAGMYNLLWGGWVILFPNVLFNRLGMAPCNYPQVWQCVGMIVGVYGIGYLIAAQDPIRHWPIILVGLLGKILGPIGMVWSLSQGTLPAAMALICVANDLIWWMPFGAILFRACKISA